MSSVNQPLHFCVLIPCYNDERGLIEALQSIRYPPQQYLAVVVDDGSTEPLNMEMLKSALGSAFPVHIIRLSHNKGITYALNKGLQWIIEHTAAPYIARLDCRDVCAADRFYQQVAYMDQYPDVGLLGSWCVFEEKETGLRYSYTTPLLHKDIEKGMHLRNVFIHPTVMYRVTAIKKTGFYPDAYPHAEDYALFWKLLKTTRVAILDKFLVTCAINRSGISYSNRQAQLRARKKVINDYSAQLWIKMFGLIKIYSLMCIPKALLLRLKSLK